MHAIPKLRVRVRVGDRVRVMVRLGRFRFRVSLRFSGTICADK